MAQDMTAARLQQPIGLSVRFDRDDAQAAADAWGFNCGPAALCAVLGMTPNEIRPHMGDFERKGYTNPTLMGDVLLSLGVRTKLIFRGNNAMPSGSVPWPQWGLVRVQWGGPWTEPGVPMRVRYRHTHWVASRRTRPIGGTRLYHNDVFDVNAMCEGGWISSVEWAAGLVPWLLRQCEPKAHGDWWPTHCIEVAR